MEEGSGRKKVFSISLGSRGGATPGIEIRRSLGGGFEVHEVQAKPPIIDMPRRDTRHFFTNRLEPAVLNYSSPWQQFLQLPRRPMPISVPSIDPQTIEIKKPLSRPIEIQRIDSYAKPQTPPVTADSPVHSPLLGQHSSVFSSGPTLQKQSPFSSGTRTIQIQRESDIIPPQLSSSSRGSPTSPGVGSVRRIEIQRVGSPLALARSDSPQSPQTHSPSPVDPQQQYGRRIEIQRSDSPLSARSDSPSQRSGSSSPTVEVHKIGPHTLEITRNVGSPGPGSPRVLEIQHQIPTPAAASKSRIIEIQRTDSPSSSPPGSPRILELKQGAPRTIPIQVSSATSRPTPQGAEAPVMSRGERIIQIQRSDAPHLDSSRMQVHRIEPPHLEIQRNEPISPGTVIRQGPMDIRWPSSRRVEIRGILGRGLQRNRTLSFTIRGGKIEMGGLEGGKIFSLRAPKEDVAVIEREIKPAIARGEPDGESNTFLRKKEAQLREKREQERLERDRQQAALEKERKEKEEKEREAAALSKLKEQQQAREQAEKEKRDLESKRELEKTAPPVVEKLENKISKKDTKLEVRKEPEKEKPVPVVEVVDTTPKPKPSVLTPAVVAKPEKPEPIKEKPVVKEKRSPPKDLSAKIPQFYFPLGMPNVTSENDSIKQKIKEIYSKLDGGKASKENFTALAKACAVSPYWKSGLFNAAGGEKSGHVTLQSCLAMWTKIGSMCHDESARFVRLFAKPGCTYLVADDFVPLIQDIVDTHPGLSFLQDAPEFHSRYVHTVISRIFYSVNRSWSGRISINELRRSCFLQTLSLLEEEEDINQITEFFSYEHFYVIYCKFWELDKDHDLFINKEDLAKHNDHAISSRMIDRIFSGAVTRGRAQKEGKMSYTEFVWFLISEEDKRHPTSIEYWFRCMDLDGDGVISMYEMEYFYEEQVQRMEALGIETLPFEDCLCQMLDMVTPKKEGCVSLADLKSCKMTPIFFDTFFNLEKYLDHEQKDPFANVRDGDEPELSDWERYAAEEYEILVAEEGANDGNQEEIMYEDDFEPDDDEPVSGRQDGALKKRPQGGNTEDDIYDFSTKDLGY